jgi:hypothetical protein
MDNLIVSTEFYSATENALAPCELKILTAVSNVFSTIDSRIAIKSRSRSMKDSIQNSLTELDKAPEFTIERIEKISAFYQNRLGNAGALYTLDFRATCRTNCGSVHIVNFVLCLSNKEAIGSNILKLELAAHEIIRHSQEKKLGDQNILGVLVTFTNNVLRAGGWDKVYATSTDYTWAYNHAYANLTKSRFLGLKLNCA